MRRKQWRASKEATERPLRGHFEQAAPLELVLRAPPLPLTLPLLHRAQQLLLLRLPVAQRLVLVGELTNPFPLVLELAVEICIRRARDVICRAGDVLPLLPLGLELTVEMRRVVGGLGGLGVAIASTLVRLAIGVRRRVVGALLRRRLRGGQRLRAVRQRLAWLALLRRLLLVLLRGAVLFALVSSAGCPRPRRRSRFISSLVLLQLEVRLELIRLDLLLLALSPHLLLAHLALQLLTIRLLRRAVGR